MGVCKTLNLELISLRNFVNYYRDILEKIRYDERAGFKVSKYTRRDLYKYGVIEIYQERRKHWIRLTPKAVALLDNIDKNPEVNEVKMVQATLSY